MKYSITEELLERYRRYLFEEEKSSATISKYLRDLRKLERYAGGRELTKEIVIAYKGALLKEGCYKTSSVNSFLTAANCFFAFMGWHELRIKTVKVQKKMFLPESRNLSKGEYRRLVRTALGMGKDRLAMILQTICATGMRVGELEYVTVQSVRRGVVEVYCKGKERQVFLPRKLQVRLLHYIRKNGLKSGSVFRTESGRAVDRSNIWREMKSLCGEAEVAEEKVFPHNLRHLFAKTFYQMNRDIAKLADVLGHSSVETTRIYIMTSGMEHKRQLDAMGLVMNCRKVQHN